MRLQDEEIEYDYDIEKSEHRLSIRNQAIECIERYFFGKSYWAGGKIPKSKLFREENIKIAMHISVLDAFAIAYYLLDKYDPEDVDVSKKGWEIEFCYEAYQECARKYIPKGNAAGILLIWLFVCHGLDFVPILKKIAEVRALIKKKEELGLEEDDDEVKEEEEMEQEWT